VEGDCIEFVCACDSEDGQNIAVVWLCESDTEGSDGRCELEEQREVCLNIMGGILLQVNGLDLQDLAVV
jgi:hypothetical protein